MHDMVQNSAVPYPCSRCHNADAQMQVHRTHPEPCHQQIPTHNQHVIDWLILFTTKLTLST